MSPAEQQVQHVVDLDGGLAIYRVHLDACQEQDKNARVMAPEKMRRLAANIEKDGRLESLPFGTISTNKAGVSKFHVISGHHRTRCARMANLSEIFVLVDTSELSKDQIVSKQLAHNALSGQDDASLLQQLYYEIEDIDLKIASGITDADIKPLSPDVKIEGINLDAQYEDIHVLFLPATYDRFEKVCERIDEKCRVLLTDYQQWDRFKTLANKVGAKFNVRNAAAIMYTLIELAEAQLTTLESE